MQRYFKNTDTLKEKYYHNLASKVIKQLTCYKERYTNLKDEKAAVKQLMIDAEKHNLRMINMKNHTVHTVVK